MKKRDLGLDVLKGMGCALMVVAHSKLKMWNYEEYIFWGNLAPAFFFSVAGVTASFQAGKSPREMLWLYGCVFLLGFSYSGFLEPNFLNSFQFEIIQTIALGVLVIYFFERYLRPQTWMYLLFGIASYGLDKLLYPFGWQRLEGLLISPGLFPLLPWLSLFFFGVFAYRAKKLHTLALFLALAGLYYFLFGWVVPDVNESKWQFLPEFFIASSTCLFGAFFLVRSFSALPRSTFIALLIFLGANSLLFLYVHYALIKFLRLFEIQRNVEVIWRHPYLFWLMVLVASTLIILAVTLLAHRFELPFRYLSMWAVMLALIFIAPFVISKASYVGYFELLIGIAFATYYPKLGKILNKEYS